MGTYLMNKDGLSFSSESFDCDLHGCVYCVNGRCIYRQSAIQQRTSKACYEEDKLADSEYEYN